jgi:nucleoside-diphosphate-sugar epimerase
MSAYRRVKVVTAKLLGEKNVGYLDYLLRPQFKDSTIVASIDPAKDRLGSQPKMNFEDGLNATVDWFRANWEDIGRETEFPPDIAPAVRGVVVKQNK